MSENFEDELNENERAALNSLKREEPPPAFLEELVVARLKNAKLLRVERPYASRRVPRMLLAATAALLIFATGAATGANWPTLTTSDSAQFMLLLNAGNESGRPRSQEEVMKAVAEYSSWARQLREQGVNIEGEKLKQESRVLGDEKSSPDSGDRLILKHRIISGYFVIAAQDYDQAVRIASGCPHLKYGGTIEVRQIDRF